MTTTQRVFGAAWALVAAVGAAAAGEARAEGMTQSDVLEIAPPRASEGVDIVVDNPFGDVRVEGSDRDTIRVATIKRAPDPDAMRRLRVGVEPEPSGSVRISTALAGDGDEGAPPVAARAIGVDLVVGVPRDRKPRVEVWRGRVEVRDLDAGVEISAQEGEVEVENVAGPIAAQLFRGDQAYRVVFGAVDVRGLSGEIDLESARGGRLGVSLYDGAVRGRDVAFREIAIVTTRGDVHLRGAAEPAGRIRIASYEGDVDVEIGADASLAVRARSREGRVDAGGEGLRGRFGMGGRLAASASRGGEPAAVELTSRIGNVRFTVVEP